MTKPIAVNVEVRRLKEMFVATSKELKGLHIADYKLQNVLDEVPSVIKALYKVDGIDVIVEESADHLTNDVFPITYFAKAA